MLVSHQNKENLPKVNLISNTSLPALYNYNNIVTIQMIVKKSNRQERMMNQLTARIKNAKSRIILGLIMSVTMATVLSFVITLSYAGFVPNLLSIWIQRLVISLTVGPPVALVLLPLVIRLVGKIVRLDISLSGQGEVQTK